jgi:ribonuclease D
MIPQIEVAICNQIEETNKQCKKIRAHLQNYPVLGFDCEWNSSTERHPVALVQLCTSSGFVALFRLNQIGQIPESLKEILEDHKVLKVGVGSMTDGGFLAKDYNIQPKGIVDIRHLVQQLTGCRLGSLNDLAQKFLGYRYFQDQTRSDWEALKLTPTQIDYASMVIKKKFGNFNFDK